VGWYARTYDCLLIRPTRRTWHPPHLVSNLEPMTVCSYDRRTCRRLFVGVISVIKPKP
jgi:hypothetical protein